MRLAIAQASVTKLNTRKAASEKAGNQQGQFCKIRHATSNCESMQFAKRQENNSKHLPACLGYKISKTVLNMCKLLSSFCWSALILLRKC